MELKMIPVESVVIGRSLYHPHPSVKNNSSAELQEKNRVLRDLPDIFQLADMASNLSLKDGVNSATFRSFSPENTSNVAEEQKPHSASVIRGPVNSNTQNSDENMICKPKVLTALPTTAPASANKLNNARPIAGKKAVEESALIAFCRSYFEQAESRILRFLQPHIKTPHPDEELKVLKARVHALLCLYLKEAVQRGMLPLFFDAFRSDNKILEFIHLLWHNIRQRQENSERGTGNVNNVATAITKATDKPRLIDRGIHDRTKTSSQFRYYPYGQTTSGEDRDQYQVRNIVGPMEQICLQPPLVELQAMQNQHGSIRNVEPNRGSGPDQSDLFWPDDVILPEITQLCSEPGIFTDLNDEGIPIDIYNFIQAACENPDVLADIQNYIEKTEGQNNSPEPSSNPRAPTSPFNPGSENQGIYDYFAPFTSSEMKGPNFGQVQMNTPLINFMPTPPNIEERPFEMYDHQKQPVNVPSPTTSASSGSPGSSRFPSWAYDDSRDASPLRTQIHPFESIKADLFNQNSPQTAPFSVYYNDQQRSSPGSPIAGLTPLLAQSPVRRPGGDAYTRSPQARRLESPAPPSPEQRSNFVQFQAQNVSSSSLARVPSDETVGRIRSPFQLKISEPLRFSTATAEIQARLDPIKKENALRAAAKLSNDDLLDPDKDGDTKLMVVCASPNCALEEVYAIVERTKCCPSAFEAVNEGVTALFMAVQFKRALIAGYVAETMVKLGLDLNKTFGQGNQLIHRFASKGDEHASCLEYLLRIKTAAGKPVFKLDAVNHNGRSALHEAVLAHGLPAPRSVSCFQIIELLIKHGANASQPESTGGKSPVHIVVEKRDPELLKHILRCAPEAANAVMYNKNAPLHSAATLREATEEDQLILVHILLQAGADKKIRNAQKKLPIELVAQDRQKVKGLLQARPKARN